MIDIEPLEPLRHSRGTRKSGACMNRDVFSSVVEAKGTSTVSGGMHPNVLRHFTNAPRHHRLYTSDNDWADWKWQQRNRITDLNALECLVTLTEEERCSIQNLGHF